MKQLGLRLAPPNLRRLSEKDGLLQVKELKYLAMVFTGEGKMEPEIDRWIRAASAECRLSVYQPIYVLALTYNHELWVKIGKTSD